MAKDVVISIPKTEQSIVELIETNSGLNSVKLSGAGMDGGGEFVLMLIPITHFTIKALVEIFRIHSEKTSKVKLEVDGMVVTGASLDEISKFLDKYAEKKTDE